MVFNQNKLVDSKLIKPSKTSVDRFIFWRQNSDIFDLWNPKLNLSKRTRPAQNELPKLKQ